MVAAYSVRGEKSRQRNLLSDRLETEKSRGSSPVTVTTTNSSESENSAKAGSRDSISEKSVERGDGAMLESERSDNALCVRPRSSKNRSASMVIPSKNATEGSLAESEHTPKTRSMSVISNAAADAVAAGDSKKKKKFIKVRASDLSATVHGGGAAQHADNSMDTKQLQDVVKRWKTEKGADDGEATVLSEESSASRHVARRPSMGGGNGRAGRAARRMSGVQANRKRSVSRRRRSISAKKEDSDDCVTDTDTDREEERTEDVSSAYSRRKERDRGRKGSSRGEDQAKRRSSSRPRSRSRSHKLPAETQEPKPVEECPQAEFVLPPLNRSRSFSAKSPNLACGDLPDDEEVDEFGFAVKYVDSRERTSFQSALQSSSSVERKGLLRASSFRGTESKPPGRSFVRGAVARSKSDDLMNFHNDIMDEEDAEEGDDDKISEKVLSLGIITKNQLRKLIEAGFQITEAEC